MQMPIIKSIRSITTHVSLSLSFPRCSHDKLSSMDHGIDVNESVSRISELIGELLDNVRRTSPDGIVDIDVRFSGARQPAISTRQDHTASQVTYAHSRITPAHSQPRVLADSDSESMQPNTRGKLQNNSIAKQPNDTSERSSRRRHSGRAQKRNGTSAKIR